jgi:hypothetical protein
VDSVTSSVASDIEDSGSKVSDLLASPKGSDGETSD